MKKSKSDKLMESLKGDLTPKMRKFCLEYLKDQNGARSAIAAGYSKNGAKVMASNLLRKKEIRDFIRSEIASQEVVKRVSAELVLQEIERIAMFDPAVLMDLAAGRKDISDLTRDERAAISEINIQNSPIGTNLKIKTHPKIKALALLAEHHNLLELEEDDRPEVYVRPDSMRNDI